MSFARGLIAPELTAEFPGLRLHWTTLEARVRASPSDLRRRLRALSDRVAGAGVVAMRTQPIPHAYRAFYRQVGLDPDAARIPSEEAAVRRLLQGRFQSRDTLKDALLIGLVETGVPVWALDARRVEVETLGIRTSVSGERLGGDPEGLPLTAGQLVVADAGCVHASLFGEPTVGHVPGPGPGAQPIVLYAVAVEGVPAIHVEEALWVCGDILRAG
jgi:DNA/RNA-binding domain of Phe-tRNA-synthetase-like protein